MLNKDIEWSADLAFITALMERPTMSTSAKKGMAKIKPAKKPKRRSEEDFNQAAFRALQETIKKSEG